MTNTKLLLQEKILFLIVLILTISCFWYFESAIIIKIFVIAIALIGIALGYRPKKNISTSSKFELLSLLILFLGSLASYYAIYNIGLPMYVIMPIVLALVAGLFYLLVTIDEMVPMLGPDNFYLYIVLMGLITLEFFLSLYFWPITPEVKSLIIVVIFYLITNLVYLYINSMLRLKRIAGYVVVSLLIIGTILLITWLKMPR
jgi:hypothetical protein